MKLDIDNSQMSNSAWRKARKKISSGIERHKDRVDTVDLDEPVAQRPRAIVITDSNGEVKFGHGNPGWTSKLPECHKRNDAGALLHPAFLRLLVRGHVDGLRMPGDFHRPAAILHAGIRIPEGLLGLLAVVVVEARLVWHLDLPQVSFDSTNLSSTMSLRLST